MIAPVPLSSELHYSLQSNDAQTVRSELSRWLERELAQLQRQLVAHTDINAILRTQGAIQVLNVVLEPLVERPTAPRSHQRPQQ